MKAAMRDAGASLSPERRLLYPHAMDSNSANAAALRAFRILESIAAFEDGCTVGQVVAATALPKQTVSRQVGQLQAAGLVIREPGGRRLQLGLRLERFALGILLNGSGRRERHAILRGLVDAIGETCNLSALVGTDIVYLDRVETEWPLRVILAPGSHVPTHATSSGKLLISMLSRAQRDRILDHLPLHRFTELTLTDRAALERELDVTRQRRIGINRGEHIRGLIAIAVPVVIGRRAVAAVAVQAPLGRMSIDEMLKRAPLLQEAAAAIAQTFDREEAR